MLLNDQLEVSGVYDSGSNVTLINWKLLKIKQKVENNNPTVNLKTINGVNKAQGALKMKIRIFDIEKYMDVFIVNNENFRYNFLIGLDCIKNFQLKRKFRNHFQRIREINFNEYLNTKNFMSHKSLASKSKTGNW